MSRPSHPALLALVVLSAGLAVGCPKEENKAPPPSNEKKATKGDDEAKKKDDGAGKKKKDGDETKKPKSGDDDDKVAAGDDDETPKSSGHSIAGVDVPAWAKPSSVGKCTLADADTKQLETLKKGDDGGAGFDDGKGDVAALVKTMKKTCATAGTLVSQALNAGGYTRYAKKDYAKADGWFARALVADPTNTFARYNLACNLALEGKTEEALWNLEQLVPAEAAGDPRALHYLTKAKTDSDLTSVKKDARFVAATAHGEPKGGMMPCPDPKQVHTKDSCIQICSAFGTPGGCTGGQSCSGAASFGAGLVPFCADTLKCKDDEELMFPMNGGELAPAPDAKRACLKPCDGDDDCGDGKKCDGVGAQPTIFGGFIGLTVCK